MSVPGERNALDTPLPLFDQAAQQRQLTRPLPPRWKDVPPAKRIAAFTALLREFLGDPAMSPQDLHDKTTQLALHPRDLTRALHTVEFTLSPHQLDTARWLIRNGTDYRPVLAGLGLLRNHAEPRDIPLLRTIGLLSCMDYLVATILAAIPGSAHDLIRLAERSSPSVRRFAAGELITHADPVVRDWVRSTPAAALPSDLARTIAEQHNLVALLDAPTVTDRWWDQAGHLLLAMTSPNNYRTEIGRYADAATVYRRWIELATSRPLTPDRLAMLISVADDLATGPAAPVVPDRAILLTNLTSMHDRLAHIDIPPTRFAIRIVTSTMDRGSDVEARIIIDGMPVVANWFDTGPAESPEKLLGTGLLRATTEPKKVRLAEAWCTEGCCGGLYVTIVREGANVVWRDWQSPTHQDLPAETRFDATEYDSEVARAEQDHDWEWPARTLARLLAEQLRADPAILGHWTCEFEWCVAADRDSGTVQLAFIHYRPAGEFTQFGLDIDVQGRDPDGLAGEIITSLRETDPKTTANKIGGSG